MSLLTFKKHPWLGALAVVGSLASANAHAAGTAAGTIINNTASVTYTDSNAPVGAPAVTVPSNTTTLRVDEILGVTVTPNSAANTLVSTPANDVPLCFTVTNPGNGSEGYTLAVNSTVTGDNYDPSDVRIYLDTNGNGIYDAGSDVLYVNGTNNPVLAPDAATVVCVTADTPAGRTNGDVGTLALTATAQTGSGTPGTTFPGVGAGGSDAVVGPTTATATANSSYQVRNLVSTLTKSQTVADPFGGTKAVPGAVVTYTIVLTTSGSGTLAASRITDAIPENTTYVPGSLRLGTTTLTDTADGDAGSFASNAVAVQLGDVVAPAGATVSFQVRIN